MSSFCLLCTYDSLCPCAKKKNVVEHLLSAIFVFSATSTFSELAQCFVSFCAKLIYYSLEIQYRNKESSTQHCFCSLKGNTIIWANNSNLSFTLTVV